MRLLIVEDKAKMADLLRRALQSEGFATDVASRGEDALWMAGSTRYDAIILDVMLPGIDGFETCRRLRALIRRRRGERPVVLEVGDLVLDPATRQVWHRGVSVDLPGKCLALLDAFMRRPGVVLSR